MKVIVYHGAYGCDTGCCGHWVEFEDGTTSDFEFSHPYGEDRRTWALAFAQEVITRRFGDGHTVDLDWENSIVEDE